MYYLLLLVKRPWKTANIFLTQRLPHHINRTRSILPPPLLLRKYAKSMASLYLIRAPEIPRKLLKNLSCMGLTVFPKARCLTTVHGVLMVPGAALSATWTPRVRLRESCIRSPNAVAFLCWCSIVKSPLTELSEVRQT